MGEKKSANTCCRKPAPMPKSGWTAKKVESTENTGNAPLPEAVKSGDAAEPVLGGNYLPRKFKTTVVIPPHNDVVCTPMI